MWEGFGEGVGPSRWPCFRHICFDAGIASVTGRAPTNDRRRRRVVREVRRRRIVGRLIHARLRLLISRLPKRQSSARRRGDSLARSAMLTQSPRGSYAVPAHWLGRRRGESVRRTMVAERCRTRLNISECGLCVCGAVAIARRKQSSMREVRRFSSSYHRWPYRDPEQSANTIVRLV